MLLNKRGCLVLEKLLEPELTVEDIIKELKSNLWIITYAIAIGLLIAVLFTVYKERVATYMATSTIIMSKEAALYFVEDQYTKSDIDLYVKSGNTYTEIASSNLVLDNTLQRLQTVGDWGNTLTRDELKKMLTAKYKVDTLVIELQGVGEQRLIIKDIVNAYADAFIEVANNLLPVAMLKVMDRAEVPEGMVESNLVRNLILGTIGGIILSVAGVIIKLLFKKAKIRTEEEVSQLLGIEVVATFE